MSWVVFALLANFFYSVSNITDQILRKKHVVHDVSFTIILMFFYFAIWAAVAPFIQISIPPIPQLIAVLASGFIGMFMVFIYVYAIAKEEGSAVMPVLPISSAFVLSLSAV